MLRAYLKADRALWLMRTGKRCLCRQMLHRYFRSMVDRNT